MLVPLIMAIWFGVRAKRCGKNVPVWAIAGAVLTYVANTLFTNIAAFLIAGSFTPRVDMDTWVTIRISGAVLSIVAMIIVSIWFLSAKSQADEGGGAETTD